ncbi:Chitin synthase, class 7 [Modicella reniformis]|uniref:Chitin synthase export chaperone n=1 Tax=Modicella reniformis TaxID=1440133 RepID=A0A9P6SS09_9FUNG|nr:Chitin synthase, class 7 [Modicella reniformis]
MSMPLPELAFGKFDRVCSTVALTLCPLIGSNGGIEPLCYSRNIKLGDSTLIFQPSTLIIHIIALIMTAIMIYHIRAKYTAVGKKLDLPFKYVTPKQ